MLAFNSSPPQHHHHHHQQAHNFLPQIPSPLSPRRTSSYPRQCMSSPIQPSNSYNFNSMSLQSPTKEPSQLPFSSRPIKQVPIRQDALRERRRDMFLRKVRQSREDAKWDSRIDDMARLDFLTSQRRWERQQSASAPPMSPDLFDAETPLQHQNQADTMSMDTSSQQATIPSEQEIEAILQREKEEMEALLALMKEDEQELHHQHERNTFMTVVGKDNEDEDDAEYDSIFMDMIDESGGGGTTANGLGQQNPSQSVNDEMDLS